MSLQKVISGTQQNFAKQTLLLGNTRWKSDDIVALLQRQVAELQAAANAKVALRQAVTQHKATYANAVVPLLALYRHYIAGMYGANSEIYASLGFPEPRKGRPSAKTTAAAVDQRQATRKARSTMGKKQKLQIKGTTTSPASAAPAPSATR